MSGRTADCEGKLLVQCLQKQGNASKRAHGADFTSLKAKLLRDHPLRDSGMGGQAATMDQVPATKGRLHSSQKQDAYLEGWHDTLSHPVCPGLQGQPLKGITCCCALCLHLGWHGVICVGVQPVGGRQPQLSTNVEGEALHRGMSVASAVASCVLLSTGGSKIFQNLQVHDQVEAHTESNKGSLPHLVGLGTAGRHSCFRCRGGACFQVHPVPLLQSLAQSLGLYGPAALSMW